MVVLALIASLILPVAPKHGHTWTTYVVSLKAPYASSKATHTQYVLGMVNSADCQRGVSSFGRIQAGPYKKGQSIRFVLKAPKSGWCAGVFHGVVHYERQVGDHWTDRRIGRFGFRVLSR